ncbi:unnamed protein product [Adineta steineri]|uniref:Uncharacterized protein n=1 Tax=Adineta steineri TaxID=433720 RepID=A0A814TK26_9BILA|nr:unnamed protein product [Adineta steineri]CAF1300235.1 unnamed protein product [Adineta steineri]
MIGDSITEDDDAAAAVLKIVVQHLEEIYKEQSKAITSMIETMKDMITKVNTTIEIFNKQKSTVTSPQRAVAIVHPTSGGAGINRARGHALSIYRYISHA